MNTKSVSTRVAKTIFVGLTAVVLLVSNPLTSHAGGISNDKKPALVTDEQVSVQYIGINDNNVVFRVQFENPTAQKFWLIIKNDAGEVVYHKQFSDAHFAKSVIFPQEEANINPTFIIRNGNNEVVRQFAVSKTVVENTVVTKL
ncbi:hypothetical protein ACX0G9_00190 [Flavitalea flava]